ncbi:SMI1/KNR4 family protein [Streptomyces sp. NPDC059072]|uniref:SMI1/KNR4 family protein n=1 Tax=Streptomyces sp. NPDC059072 TaxID=3346715 RepID=UPI0036C7CE20
MHVKVDCDDVAEAESLTADLGDWLVQDRGMGRHLTGRQVRPAPIVGHSSVNTVWPVEQIVDQNLLYRSDVSFARLYMPFDALLFFGDHGGGDRFAFVQTPRRPDIFVWEHETDSRRWVARDLADYLGRSLAEGGDNWYQ